MTELSVEPFSLSLATTIRTSSSRKLRLNGAITLERSLILLFKFR
jgi:hypothetical protein